MEHNKVIEAMKELSTALFVILWILLLFVRNRAHRLVVRCRDGVA